MKGYLFKSGVTKYQREVDLNTNGTNKTMINRVTRGDIVDGAFNISIIFKPSPSIIEYIEEGRDTNALPLTQVSTGRYEYTEHIRYSEEVEELLKLIGVPQLDSGEFLQLLKKLDEYWV